MLKLEKENPNKKVGLVTFNHEVCSYGDGTTETLTFNGDVLNDKDSIKQKSQSTYVYKPIIETKNNLREKMLQ